MSSFIYILVQTWRFRLTLQLWSQFNNLATELASCHPADTDIIVVTSCALPFGWVSLQLMREKQQLFCQNHQPQQVSAKSILQVVCEKF